jgi:Tol biopolymer transport system component
MPACGARKVAPEPPTTAEGGNIVFSAFAGDGICMGLYVIRADGGDLRRLTGPGPQRPSFSADSRLLAFSVLTKPAREELGLAEFDFFVLDTRTGSIERKAHIRVTLGSLEVPTPRWSPLDNTLLVTNAYRSNQVAIERVDAATGERQSLAREERAVDVFPAWSPDGSKIAYTHITRKGGWTIWLMDADGGRKRMLAADGSQPVWSADGRSVSFLRPGDATVGSELWTMRPDGSGAHRVAGHVTFWPPGLVRSPSGGEWLVVRNPRRDVSGGEDSGDLYAKDVKTGRESLLAQNVTGLSSAPAGKGLILLRPASGQTQIVQGIYTTTRFGGDDHLIAVTDDEDVQASSTPTWQPRLRDIQSVSSSPFAVPRNAGFCLEKSQRRRDFLASRRK